VKLIHKIKGVIYLIYNINKEQELFGRLHASSFSTHANTEKYNWHCISSSRRNCNCTLQML